MGGFVPLLTLVPLLYPDGRLPGPRWRPWVVTSASGMVLLAVGSAAYPGGGPSCFPRRRAPAGAVVHRRAGRARGPLAPRGRAGAPPGAVLLVTAGVLVVDTLLQPLLAWPVGALTQAVAVALVPVAIGVAVTRHRLYDLDLAVCRAIGGLSLAVCLAGIYVTLFLLAAALLPGGPTVGRGDRGRGVCGCCCIRSGCGSTVASTGCSTATAPTPPGCCRRPPRAA